MRFVGVTLSLAAQPVSVFFVVSHNSVVVVFAADLLSCLLDRLFRFYEFLDFATDLKPHGLLGRPFVRSTLARSTCSHFACFQLWPSGEKRAREVRWRC